MSTKISTLRPGLLVSLKTSVRGNVSYRKVTLEADRITEAGTQEAKWETERVIVNPVEYEEAKKIRSKAGGVIRSVCSASAFGLLCPEIASDQLDAAIQEAKALVEAFNKEAELTRVGVYVMTGRIAPDDVEAVRAINSEVRDLLADMEQGLRNLDVKSIREAASRAKSIGEMLSPDAQARITIAIETAREAARNIVRAGETASVEIDRRAIAKITEQRTAFLDLDDAGEVIAPPETGRALDFSQGIDASMPEATVPTLEVE